MDDPYRPRATVEQELHDAVEGNELYEPLVQVAVEKFGIDRPTAERHVRILLLIDAFYKALGDEPPDRRPAPS